MVGPFQGKPACVRIALDRGVCGAAASQRRTQVVPDVHAFPGHIACDAASRSEIVVPLVRDGTLIGVWDVDSPLPGASTRTTASAWKHCARFSSPVCGREAAPVAAMRPRLSCRGHASS